MNSPLPDPLIPVEVDLRGYEFMPYYGDRLRESDLNSRATDAEYRAAHNLWWSSWKQVPAASVPNDDIVLCRLADLGRDQKTWSQVKERALHGFTLCSDNRYYHQLISVLALEAWDARTKARKRGEAGASKRWGKAGNAATKENDSKGEERKGKEKKKNNGVAFAPPAWIPSETWKGFEDMRNRIRKPMTEHSKELIVRELEKLRDQGFDPVAVLEQSERNSWQDVFPLKAKDAGKGAAPVYDLSRFPDAKV